ncbi:hypothetical protein NMG60_11022490 [Bertholletia excelsa]
MNRLKHHFFQPPIPPPSPSSSTAAPATTSRKSFNAIMNRLSSDGAHEDVLLAYSSMLRSHIPPDAFTFPSLLKACTSLNLLSHGLSLHQSVIVTGYSSDSYIGSSLINFYAKFGYTYHARQVFDIMPERNVVPWTAIIGCYSRSGEVDTAVHMYNQMRKEGVPPTSVTMLGLLSGALEVAHVQCVHAGVIQHGFVSDWLWSLFKLMDRRDLVSWNSLVSGYASVGNIGEILHLIREMKVEGVDPDQQTLGSLVSAAARQSNSEMGRLVHAWILSAGFELDAQLETSLIVMYLKCGYFDDAFRVFGRASEKDMILWTAMISGLVQKEFSSASPTSSTIASALSACGQLVSLTLGTSIHAYMLRQRIPLDVTAQNSLQSSSVFEAMQERDVVSWNAIVAGYAQKGNLTKSFHLFNEMREALQRPDSLTIVSLLQASASTGALHQGKWIHNFVVRNCFGPCILIETALVDIKCFKRMSKRDLVSWSSIITGYGSHGKGKAALEMYNEFLLTGCQPNHAIFLSALSACSHNGLVDEGLNVFYSMERDFGIEPKLEHLACVVDLLCRAGRVEDAYDFYSNMFLEPSVDRGNLAIGDIIAGEIFKLRPTDAGNYLQLAHNYASMGRWEGVSEAWTQMRSLGLRKLPGWSFIELNGSITTFFTHHILNILTKDIKDLGICVIVAFIKPMLQAPDVGAFSNSNVIEYRGVWNSFYK